MYLFRLLRGSSEDPTIGDERGSKLGSSLLSRRVTIIFPRDVYADLGSLKTLSSISWRPAPSKGEWLCQQIQPSVAKILDFYLTVSSRPIAVYLDITGTRTVLSVGLVLA
jgi:hypothetical protein